MSKELQEKDRSLVWHPYTSLSQSDEPLLVKAANGVFIELEDGRKILDAVSSWWVNLHGHAHPYLVEALTAQAASMEHVIFAGFTHKPAIILAERLLSILPGNQKRIFYSDNGSTAVEAAIKMAMQYQQLKNNRTGKVLAIDGAFHGDTFGAMSVSGRGLFTDPFSNHLFDVDFVPFPEEEAEEMAISEMEALLNSGTYTSFIYEPLIQGAAGMRIYRPEILDRMMKLAKKFGLVCIADEVMTGFGRTGKLFASDYMEEKPDIYCLSKGITGGFMPFGATTCNGEIEHYFLSEKGEATFYHGHSYTGNPMACALANASLDLLLDTMCSDRIEMIHNAHIQFLSRVEKFEIVKKAKVLGTILSIEIQTEDSTGYTNALKKELYHYFLSKNILLRPLGNIIYIIPPYVIDEIQLESVYNAIEEFLLTKFN